MTTPPAAPGRGGSRRRPGGRRRSGRIYNIAVGLVLAAVAVGAQHYALTPAEQEAPLASTGGIREEVATGRYTAKVNTVAAARSIEAPDGRTMKRIETDKVFLIVQASVTAPKEPTHIDGVLLTADGKRYEATDRMPKTLTLANPWIQPGWWVTGPLVFEVPVEVVAGASLVVLPEQGAMLIEPYPPEAVIDLGLDDAAAKALVAQAQDPYSMHRNR
ncbi:hypothetical protein [Spongiactinospora sp. TRM90649]|uniref:hypothetical protein n=1 Tax=Spongiactinospora sp. TRM90649 TaxID=3031114 RepID=UPI0023F8FD0F|nr:hypothetical protein [Spongiactinospora sp. TRM90649]MDF5751779.1 hypothetical protein [Spongiactinospora sp. TRM90649]